MSNLVILVVFLAALGAEEIAEDASPISIGFLCCVIGLFLVIALLERERKTPPVKPDRDFPKRIKPR